MNLRTKSAKKIVTLTKRFHLIEVTGGPEPGDPVGVRKSGGRARPVRTTRAEAEAVLEAQRFKVWLKDTISVGYMVGVIFGNPVQTDIWSRG